MGRLETCKNEEKTKIVTDPITGLPVLSAGPDALILTSKEVSDILEAPLDRDRVDGSASPSRPPRPLR